jgi:predicted DNA-binding WGR domain protein
MAARMTEPDNSANETSSQSVESTGNGNDAGETGQDSTIATSQIDGKSTRYFEFTDGKSNKFWEITLHVDRHSVRFGRIGSKGQEVTRSFSGVQQARADFERLIRQKVAKGYREK